MTLAPPAFLRARLDKVRAAMEPAHIDVLVVTHLENLFYLSNHAASAGILVVTRTDLHLLADSRYVEAIARLQGSPGAPPGLRVWDVPASYDEALLGCLTAIGATRVGVEGQQITLARWEWLLAQTRAQGLPFRWVSTEGVVENARVTKDAHELTLMRRSAARIAPVAEAAFRVIRPGVSERDVAGTIESAMRAQGFDRPAFDTIVGSGPNGALPHYRAGDRALEMGDLVVLDFGGVLDGYCCDLTRTVSVGPPAAEARRVYAAVLDAQEAAIGRTRPGVAASDVDAAARAVLDARGLGAAFGHGTGHGLGLEVHEAPRVGRPRPDPPPHSTLEPGMVFTVEPGAYLPGWGGVRIEDDVLVTESGCELLTSVTRDLLAL